MTENQTEVIFGQESKESGSKIFVRDEDFEASRGDEYKLAIEFLIELNKNSILVVCLSKSYPRVKKSTKFHF